MYENMHVQSPHSYRWIRRLDNEGSPISASTISTLGGDVVTFADRMTEAGGKLNSIRDRTSEQQGKAIDKLQESVGESGDVLISAGEMYKPFGEAIKEYGDSLQTHLNSVNSAHTRAMSALVAFNDLPGSHPPRGAGGWFQPEEGSDEAEKNAKEDEAKGTAWQTYLDRAEEWETATTSWETLYDNTVEKIGGVLDKGISDGWKEWLENIASFLAWAGLIVGIAALIIGGPILGALAALIGVLSLVVTIAQMIESGEWDFVKLAFAVVGALPFGSLGKLGQFRFGEFFSDWVGKGLWGKGGSIWKGGKSLFDGWKNGGDTITSKIANIAKTQWKAGNPFTGAAGTKDFLSRLLTGKGSKHWMESGLLYALGNGPGNAHSWMPGAMLLWEVGWSGLSTIGKYDGWLSTIGGWDSAKSHIPGASYIF